jgi:hypothetical protein
MLSSFVRGHKIVYGYARCNFRKNGDLKKGGVLRPGPDWGPPGDIIARGRPSFAAQSNFTIRPKLNFLEAHRAWCQPGPFMARPGLITPLEVMQQWSSRVGRRVHLSGFPNTYRKGACN